MKTALTALDDLEMASDLRKRRVSWKTKLP